MDWFCCHFGNIGPSCSDRDKGGWGWWSRSIRDARFAPHRNRYFGDKEEFAVTIRSYRAATLGMATRGEVDRRDRSYCDVSQRHLGLQWLD